MERGGLVARLSVRTKVFSGRTIKMERGGLVARLLTVRTTGFSGRTIKYSSTQYYFLFC